MKLRRVEGQMDKVRDAALLRTVFDTCKSLASEAEARAAAMDWLSCITDKIGGYPPFVNGILDKKPRKMRFTACLDKVTRGAGITYEAFVDCFGAPNIP